MADAGRVIAGIAKGTRLRSPGDGTRPMGDRVKQTLFAILEPMLRGARVSDLFAGSGAGGIEALSRGAAAAGFVEKDAGAGRVIEENIARSRLTGGTAHVVRADATDWLSRVGPDEAPFDVVLIDPPYAQPELLEAVLRRLGDPASGLLRAGSVVVAKHFWRTPPPERGGLLASERARRFGETALTFYRRQPTDGEG
jgi:16S rRNA (guanine966-N2)-methyltransferase